jgi:hypothetical protein
MTTQRCRWRAGQRSRDARKNHAFFSNSVIAEVNRSAESVAQPVDKRARLPQPFQVLLDALGQ